MDARGSWRVPGYVADELIGFGTSGEVWRGRALRTGETVALRRLTADIDIRQLNGLLAWLDEMRHPHILRIREVVGSGRSTALVSDFAGGGSLAVLLRRRGRLRPGEVVTALAPVAAALAYVHGEGRSHGAVTPANILFTVDGRPLLADLGLAELAATRAGSTAPAELLDPAPAVGALPDPAGDVFMLATVAAHALVGAAPGRRADSAVAAGSWLLTRLPATVPEPMVRALRRALAARPEVRGGAAGLALDLRHGCDPEPVRLAEVAIGRSGDVSTVDTTPTGLRPGRAAPTVTPATGSSRAARAAAGPEPPEVTARAGGLAGPRHRLPEPVRRGADGPDPRRSARILGGIGAALIVGSAGVLWAAGKQLGAPVGGAGASAADERGADSLSAGPAGPGPAAPADEVGAGPAPGPTGVSAGSMPSADWHAVLDGLDSIRARAYEHGEVGLLQQVYVTGPHLAADSAQLSRIVDAGETVRGVRHRLRVTSVLSRQPTRVRLRVLQSLPDSTRVRLGQTVAVVPGVGETAIDIELTLTGQGWRLV